MDLIKLLSNLNGKLLDTHFMVQDSTLGSESEYQEASFRYERLLHVVGRIYNKISHFNHPLVRRLHDKDMREIIAIGAPSYEGVE